MKKLFIILSVAILATSCSRGPQDTGLEFAPNMYISHPLDPLTKPENQSFPYNPDDTSLAMITPVKGTIARGQWDYFAYNLPKDSLALAGRTLKSPYKGSEEILSEGEELYGRFCDHCHGTTGMGDGPVADPKKFAGVAKLAVGQVATVSEGHIYHVITHGKGRMGAHASQLNPSERWKIVHYVMSLRQE